MEEIILKLTQNINTYHSQLTVSIHSTIVRFIEESYMLNELRSYFQIDGIKQFHDVEVTEVNGTCKRLLNTIQNRELECQISVFREKFSLDEEDINVLHINEVIHHIIYMCESSKKFKKVIIGYRISEDDI